MQLMIIFAIGLYLAFMLFVILLGYSLLRRIKETIGFRFEAVVLGFLFSFLSAVFLVFLAMVLIKLTLLK
jgi:ATP/ADP translocase